MKKLLLIAIALIAVVTSAHAAVGYFNGGYCYSGSDAYGVKCQKVAGCNCFVPSQETGTTSGY